MPKDRQALIEDLARWSREHTAPEDRPAAEALIAEIRAGGLVDVPTEVEIPTPRPTEKQWALMKLIHAFAAGGVVARRKELAEKLGVKDGALGSLLDKLIRKGLIKHVLASGKKKGHWLLTEAGEYWIGKADELDALYETATFGLPFPQPQKPLRLRDAPEVTMTSHPGGVERSVRVVGEFDQEEGPNQLRILRPKKGGIRIETRVPIGFTVDVPAAPQSQQDDEPLGRPGDDEPPDDELPGTGREGLLKTPEKSPESPFWEED